MFRLVIHFLVGIFFLTCSAYTAYAQDSTLKWHGINPAKAADHFSNIHIIEPSGLAFMITKTKSSTLDAMESFIVYLANDAVIEWENDDIKIFDFAHTVVANVKGEANEISSSSFFPLIVFRQYEFRNRFYLRDILTQAGVELTPNFEPLWFEGELGITDPKSGIEFDFEKDGSSLKATFQGQEVVKVTWGNKELSENEVEQFWRYIRWTTSLHPKIIERLKNEQRLPSEIFYRGISYGNGEIGLVDRALSLTVVNDTTLDLPQNLTPAPFETQIGEDVKEGSAKAVLLKEIFIAASTISMENNFDFEKHAKQGLELLEGPRPLDGILALMMAYIQEAENCSEGLGSLDFIALCQKILQGIRQINNFEEGRLLVTALNSKTAPEAAVKILGRLRSNDLEYNFWLGQFMANILWGQNTTDWDWEGVAVEDRDPVNLYAATFRANHFIPSFYKDVGDFYAAGALIPNAAWVLYDIGRSISNLTFEDNILSFVTKKENQIRATLPAFFMAPD